MPRGTAMRAARRAAEAAEELEAEEAAAKRGGGAAAGLHLSSCGRPRCCCPLRVRDSTDSLTRERVVVREVPPLQVGKLDRGHTYAPKISRRYAPGFHQKQGKRPKIFRRYAPEPYKSCKKAQNFPALRAGRPTTRFPRTYSICLYSPVFQPGPTPRQPGNPTRQHPANRQPGLNCPGQTGVSGARRPRAGRQAGI